MVVEVIEHLITFLKMWELCENYLGHFLHHKTILWSKQKLTEEFFQESGGFAFSMEEL